MTVAVDPPSAIEYELVARCLLSSGVLIGSPKEVWSHPGAARALRTMRRCVEVIEHLVASGSGITPSNIRAVVSRGLYESPYCLEELAEFLVDDPRARAHWGSAVRDDMFPHRCPLCKRAAAFVGYNLVECKARCNL